jgi:hypothetical protein
MSPPGVLATRLARGFVAQLGHRCPRVKRDGTAGLPTGRRLVIGHDARNVLGTVQGMLKPQLSQATLGGHPTDAKAE